MAQDSTFGQGFLRAKSNAQLDAEERQREREKAPPEAPKHIKELAAHIRKCYQEAKDHKDQTVTPRLLDCQRRRKGVYESSKLAEIQKVGGCQLYWNITDTKCGAAEAWIQDVVRPTADQPWTIEPTPLPDLPNDMRQRIHAQVTQWYQEAVVNGIQPSYLEVRDLILDEYRKTETGLKEEADDACETMATKILDQHAEGGWESALDDVIRAVCTYPIGIIYGPDVKRVKRMKWVGEEAQAVDEVIPTWRAVDPHDFFPAPNIRSVNEGYVCETVRIPDEELSLMRGQDGYSTEEIEYVLSQMGDEKSSNTLTDASTGEPERAALEQRDTSIAGGAPKSAKDGILFHGSVQGRVLLEWGMKVDDSNGFYPIVALLIGNHVVKAITNPDPLGKAPYFIASYENVSGDLWGKAIAEKMTDIQDAVNDCNRALINNLALASGPQVVVDVDALDASQDPTLIYPWKPWQVHGNESPNKTPISFFQPSSNAAELQAVAENLEAKADDRTLIPRYAHGNPEVAGAGETYGGLTMLMEAAAKGIKRVIANLDRDIVRPAIEHLHRWNLKYLDDDEYRALKGDIRVVPRGVLAALVHEEVQRRRQQFLETTNNPVDNQIVRIRNRAALMRAIAKDLDLPVEQVVPSDEELAQILQQEQAQAMAQAQMEAEAKAAPPKKKAAKSTKSSAGRK